MQSEDRHAHWQDVYTKKAENEVSWFQESPAPSIELIMQVGATRASPIIDIGGGASRLVDNLIENGFEDVTVLDISEASLQIARTRLGNRAAKVDWIVDDVTTWVPTRTYDIWHDRATFHFLTVENDRTAYAKRLKQALKVGGHAIIATFALDGPERCSGLPVVRYDPEGLGRILGPAFELTDRRQHRHATPWGTEQSFQFSVFRRTDIP
ncbi:class I SAM-dependent methyltransferase [Bradyrhizobium sp. Arg237L]|uniref:class I SAM-dependent methyltransferase n=1 Tax=Bradyrhizobium sp. Arg237L TaxID=3003352 RepID=UPI00249E2F5C|nr:class I SAM-dependent methyltransferase [Bradyrhizobium sp. Arg237L]MDI4234294.1 class I SAM-dependent methyltransferase [Bradyrhizobium sp. Arg237L]